MSNRKPSILVAAALFTTSGCMPQVLHGPRVEPGTTGALHVSVTKTGEGYGLGAGEITILPTLNGGVRHGWVSPGGRSAASLGLQVPILGIIVAGTTAEDVRWMSDITLADLYLQPWRDAGGAADFGAGVMASTGVAMPYVQYGHTLDSGNSWYVTQAVVMYGGDEVLWLPSLTWREDGRGNGRAVHFTASAGVPASGETRIGFLNFGITTELGLPRAR